jgi:hypothetical protein
MAEERRFPPRAEEFYQAVYRMAVDEYADVSAEDLMSALRTLFRTFAMAPGEKRVFYKVEK